MGTKVSQFQYLNIFLHVLQVQENLEDLAKMDVVDNGKPIWEARMDLETVIDSLQYYGGMGESY